MKRLILIGLSAIALAACGNDGQKQAEATEESTAVEAVSSQSETKETGYVRQSTEATVAQIRDIQMGIPNENAELGPTYEELVELFEAEADTYDEFDGGEHIALWRSPRNQTSITVRFENDRAIIMTLENEKAKGMPAEDHAAIITDGSVTYEQLESQFGVPSSYVQAGAGGYNTGLLKWRQADDDSKILQVDLEDGVVTGKYPKSGDQ